ncbi:MAG: histidine phosphatase family protein [Clostridia bacterium]
MIRLILVRHGEAEGNLIRKFHGHYDSKLTPNGHQQVQKLSERMEKEEIDILYSSDLSRAYETARYIAEKKHMDIQVIEGLREINGGDWENIPWADLPHKWPESYNHWEKSPHLLQMPNGESMVEFQQRVVKEIMSLIKNSESENICVVTHGTVIKVLLCFFYGKPLEEIVNIQWHDNASITIINIDQDNYHVVIEGDNRHLGELSTLAKQDWWKK